MYVRKIGIYLCFSMADNLGWVEHVGGGGTCGGEWSMWVIEQWGGWSIVGVEWRMWGWGSMWGGWSVG